MGPLPRPAVAGTGRRMWRAPAASDLLAQISRRDYERRSFGESVANLPAGPLIGLTGTSRLFSAPDGEEEPVRGDH